MSKHCAFHSGWEQSKAGILQWAALSEDTGFVSRRGTRLSSLLPSWPPRTCHLVWPLLYRMAFSAIRAVVAATSLFVLAASSPTLRSGENWAHPGFNNVVEGSTRGMDHGEKMPQKRLSLPRGAAARAAFAGSRALGDRSSSFGSTRAGHESRRPRSSLKAQMNAHSALNRLRRGRTWRPSPVLRARSRDPRRSRRSWLPKAPASSRQEISSTIVPLATAAGSATAVTATPETPMLTITAMTPATTNAEPMVFTEQVVPETTTAATNPPTSTSSSTTLPEIAPENVEEGDLEPEVEEDSEIAAEDQMTGSVEETGLQDIPLATGNATDNNGGPPPPSQRPPWTSFDDPSISCAGVQRRSNPTSPQERECLVENLLLLNAIGTNTIGFNVQGREFSEEEVEDLVRSDIWSVPGELASYGVCNARSQHKRRTVIRRVSTQYTIIVDPRLGSERAYWSPAVGVSLKDGGELPAFALCEVKDNDERIRSAARLDFATFDLHTDPWGKPAFVNKTLQQSETISDLTVAACEVTRQIGVVNRCAANQSTLVRSVREIVGTPPSQLGDRERIEVAYESRTLIFEWATFFLFAKEFYHVVSGLPKRTTFRERPFATVQNFFFIFIVVATLGFSAALGVISLLGKLASFQRGWTETVITKAWVLENGFLALQLSNTTYVVQSRVPSSEKIFLQALFLGTLAGLVFALTRNHFGPLLSNRKKKLAEKPDSSTVDQRPLTPTDNLKQDATDDAV